MTKTTADPGITRDGIKVEVGQRWRNCDWRSHGRTRVVASIDLWNNKVIWAEPPRSKVSIRRMYKHSTGWELVS